MEAILDFPFGLTDGSTTCHLCFKPGTVTAATADGATVLLEVVRAHSRGRADGAANSQAAPLRQHVLVLSCCGSREMSPAPFHRVAVLAQLSTLIECPMPHATTLLDCRTTVGPKATRLGCMQAPAAVLAPSAWSAP